MNNGDADTLGTRESCGMTSGNAEFVCLERTAWIEALE